MPLRTVASFAVAILLGLIAVLLVRGMVSKKSGGPQATATQAVLVAIAPIQRGVTLTPQLLKSVRYPVDALPAGSFQSTDQLFGKGAPERVTQRAIALNEPVLASKLSGPGSAPMLSAIIHPGMRAVSLRSSDVAGVGGFVLPGDKVDILLTRTAGSAPNAPSVTQALAENALVLGVDQTSDQGADKPVVAKSVTVEVTPEQAQAISLAESVGQLSLSLRQGSDNAPLSKRLTTVSDLGPVTRSTAPPARRLIKTAAPAAPATAQVHVVRGVESASYSVGIN